MIFDEENQLGGGTKIPQTVIHNDAHLLSDLVKAANVDLLNQDVDGNSTLNIATLQRMVLFRLQRKIIEKAAPLTDLKSGDFNALDDPELQKAIADYAQGVRDWELMVEHGRRAKGDPTKDPFCISSKWRLTSRVMNRFGVHAGDDRYRYGTLNKHIGIFDQRNRVNRARDLKELSLRFSMSIVGGVALIGPVLLMVLHKTIVTDLVTTSVAVVVVSALLTVFSSATPEMLLNTITAYTAVLVVFVGTLQPA
ncbi:hypothetical protein O1611_g5462 [Lasiodiplodia mahajangana]|uniref:Uncharacterized protein n=1 Tax=Lasiodiplodia mahajangana TaxID=1108764 RepID=A0ACC2JLA8_9PEZI|nr:hypothetical protein O1611_g5462 [Lasiodiplodia mahajangana]